MRLALNARLGYFYCVGGAEHADGLPQNAEVSLGISPDASTIAAASKLLLDMAVRRRQAVRLCWPYGGHSMEVAGDVLGGWHLRVPLQQRRSDAGCSTTIEVRSHAAPYCVAASA